MKYVISDHAAARLREMMKERPDVPGVGETGLPRPRQVTHVLTTGPVDGDGFYPCLTAEYITADDTWEFGDVGPLVFSPNGPLAEGEYYTVISAADKASGGTITGVYVTTEGGGSGGGLEPDPDAQAAWSTNQNNLEMTGTGFTKSVDPTVTGLTLSGIDPLSIFPDVGSGYFSIINDGSYPFTILDNSALSSAGNRFSIPGGDMSAPVGSITHFYYDSSAGVIRLASSSSTTQSGVVGFKRAYLASPATTSSAVLVNMTGMSFAIAANEIWEIDVQIRFSPAAAAGSVVGINGPAGGGVAVVAEGNDLSAVARTEEAIVLLNTPTAAQWCQAAGYVKLRGIVSAAGTAGTIQIQFATINPIQTTTAAVGTVLIAHRMSP